MSPSSSPPPSREDTRLSRLGLSRRTLLWIAGAFVLGLLLFVLATRGQRERDDEFFRSGPSTAPSAGQDPGFQPLPTPVGPADGRSVDGNEEAGNAMPEETEGGVIEEPALGDEAMQPVAPPSPPTQGTATASARPVRAPQPVYPPEAMRDGESGTVLLQVQVDASGHPVRVDVVQSSRSRALDRAAREAVERWEFSPALRNGRPVPAKVLVPIDPRP